MITDNPHHSRRWTILAILAIAQLMVILDTTVVKSLCLRRSARCIRGVTLRPAQVNGGPGGLRSAR